MKPASESSPSLRFALVGAAGFVAPRHMQAIRETGHELVAALDPNDSVGVIDSWFPEADFFTEVERFDRHLDKLRREGRGVDYLSICSPNYLHDAHIRMALRSGAQAICEKPVVLNPWNAEALEAVERDAGRRVWCILQLRHHPAIVALRDSRRGQGHRASVEVTYVASRGRWYHRSWKGSLEKSGGVATNIGIHLFDMLQWIFGGVRACAVHRRDEESAAGVLELERATVRWFLSVQARHLPPASVAAGRRTFRSIRVDGVEAEFSEGFADLHTESYRAILAGRGFGLSDAAPSIRAVHDIRHAPLERPGPDAHPMAAAAGSP